MGIRAWYLDIWNFSKGKISTLFWQKADFPLVIFCFDNISGRIVHSFQFHNQNYLSELEIDFRFLATRPVIRCLQPSIIWWDVTVADSTIPTFLPWWLVVNSTHYLSTTFPLAQSIHWGLCNILWIVLCSPLTIFSYKRFSSGTNV